MDLTVTAPIVSLVAVAASNPKSSLSSISNKRLCSFSVATFGQHVEEKRKDSWALILLIAFWKCKTDRFCFRINEILVIISENILTIVVFR